ncbi:MAG TPA: AAA family ATPase [Nanoarchaeota archaeon]|nr:AAA family ATPase [Nanoarchaeota archaeon]
MATVIALVGDIGSGKGAAADYLEQRYQLHKHTVSDFIRSEARARKVKPTRENLEKLSAELRERFGKQYFIKKVIAKIESDRDKRCVIDGVRLASDVSYLRRHFGNKVKVVFITASLRTRFERMKARGRPGDPAFWEQFLLLEEKEEHEFHLSRVFRLADYTIRNEGKLSELHNNLDVLIEKYIPK